MKLSFELNVFALNDRELEQLAKEVFDRLSTEDSHMVQRIMEKMDSTDADMFQGNVSQATKAIWG